MNKILLFTFTYCNLSIYARACSWGNFTLRKCDSAQWQKRKNTTYHTRKSRTYLSLKRDAMEKGLFGVQWDPQVLVVLDQIVRCRRHIQIIQYNWFGQFVISWKKFHFFVAFPMQWFIDANEQIAVTLLIGTHININLYIYNHCRCQCNICKHSLLHYWANNFNSIFMIDNFVTRT